MMTIIITTQIILTQITIMKTIKKDETSLLIFSVKEVIWVHLASKTSDIYLVHI